MNHTLFQLVTSDDERDADIFVALINTEEELFNALWIMNIAVMHIDCWGRIGYYDMLLEPLSEKFEMDLSEVDREIADTIRGNVMDGNRRIQIFSTGDRNTLLKEIEYGH